MTDLGNNAPQGMRRPSAITKVEQLQHLILEKIRRGDYPLGSQLPGLRALAQETGTHANTVAQAYRELAERGILRSEQGRGTFVLRKPREEQFPPTRVQLQGELRQLAAWARDSGLAPDEFLASARQALQEAYRQTALKLFFVECNPFDTRELADSIGRLFQLRVEPLLVDDLLERPDTYRETADLFITTSYHIDEIEAVVAKEQVIGVSVTPTTGTLIALARTPPNARIAVVASNQRTLQRMVRMVHITARKAPTEARLIDDPALLAALQEVDIVVDSQAIHARVLEQVQGSILTVHFQLEANAVEFLRARLRDLFPERLGKAEETALSVS